MAPDDPFPLFVYGTLMRGGVRNHLLDGRPFLGTARTLPRYELLDLGEYPGLIPCTAGGNAIEGEVYSVAASLRDLLDAEEGAPDLFRLSRVALDRGRPAWSYLYRPDPRGLPRYPAARWVNRTGHGK